MIRLHFYWSSVWFSWCDTVIDCSSVMAVSALKNLPNKNHHHVWWSNFHRIIYLDSSVEDKAHLLLIHSENLHLSPFCGYYECMSNFALYLFIEALLFIWKKEIYVISRGFFVDFKFALLSKSFSSKFELTISKRCI